MADLRRRKPDDDIDKLIDDSGASESQATIDANASDDEQTRQKPASGLTTADSSDHVSVNNAIILNFTMSL